MTTATKRSKRGGGQLGRTAVVTIRLDPKLRYLVELAARQQRRTVSALIEWVLAQQVPQLPIDEHTTIGEVTDILWNVKDDIRFTQLATQYPHLLTYDEQCLWEAHKQINS
jgi:hypothetical protein